MRDPEEISNGLEGGGENGAKFLVGYRKFIVAVLWMALTGFSVVWVVVEKNPTSGKITLVIWLVASAGFFCSFFAGGNALAKLWASKYAPPQTTASLAQQTTQTLTEYRYVNEDASFAFDNKDLPPPRRR